MVTVVTGSLLTICTSLSGVHGVGAVALVSGEHVAARGSVGARVVTTLR